MKRVITELRGNKVSHSFVWGVFVLEQETIFTFPIAKKTIKCGRTQVVLFDSLSLKSPFVSVLTDSLPHLPLHQDSAIAPMCCWALRVCVYTVCVCVTSTTSTPVTIANIPCRSCFPLLKGWYRQRQRTHRSFLRLNAKSSSACWKGKKNR